MRRWFSAPRAVALLVAVVAVLFIVQNRNRVVIEVFLVHISAPVWLVLTVMTVTGMVVGVLWSRRT